MTALEEKIERIKKDVIAARTRENELRILEAKTTKVKLLDTEPNFFIASNDRGFIVMHLEEFMKLSKTKQNKIIENYR